jgi:hypothetical protein
MHHRTKTPRASRKRRRFAHGGPYRDQPIANIPTDYLNRATGFNLSHSLAAAINTELTRRTRGQR